MKKNKCLTAVIFVLFTVLVGFISGMVTRGGVEEFFSDETILKPEIIPPNIVFPIVWTILFVLMGVSVARIWNSEKSFPRSRSLILFVFQLAVNFIWSILFFNFQAFGFAFFWLVFLWILILAMIVSYCRVDKAAAALQIPYLIWVTFAGYLSFNIWMLNS